MPPGWVQPGAPWLSGAEDGGPAPDTLQGVLGSLLLAAVVTLPVPFVPQQRDTCGAAALAMVLQYYGLDVVQDAIAAELVEPELGGIRGSRLAEFARSRGMVAIAFAGDAAVLREHLAKGRPLVVALSAGGSRNHDVVVVGFDEGRHEVIVNDPAVGAARRMSDEELERRWGATGHWTLLVQPLAAAGERSGEAPSASSAPAPAPAAQLPAPSPAPSQQIVALPAFEPDAASYEALVERAIALGRADRRVEAAALLDRAVTSSPERPEAWVERGGLSFLDGRYEPAIADLRRALAIRDDPYVRDLLASSLQLAGRELEALAVWNALGKPTLGRVEISGLKVTHDDVARREVGIEVGSVLTPKAVRAARRRLGETGIFEKVTLRPKPRGDGSADLSVALLERHGFAHGPVDLLVTTGVGLAWQRVRLRYANLGGTGLGFGGTWRWQKNRPETSLELRWPRPFGLPVYLDLSGSRGEQAYELGEPFAIRQRGFDLGARHVLRNGSLLSLGLRLRERNVSSSRPDAAPGRILGLQAGLEGRLLETRRNHFDASAHLLAADPVIGSQLSYLQGEAELRYEGIVSRPEGRSVERSVAAARLRGGWGSSGLPVDEMHAVGVSFESDIPLRAHPLTRQGIIGRNPVGRSFLVLNAEWRQRLLHRSLFDIGAVAFMDTAGVWQPAQGSASRVLVDAGVGLRVSLLAGATLRIDQAWGLRDGGRSLSIGLNQAF
jgi:tetratricopeptide (TPR) repeat protein